VGSQVRFCRLAQPCAGAERRKWDVVRFICWAVVAVGGGGPHREAYSAKAAGLAGRLRSASLGLYRSWGVLNIYDDDLFRSNSFTETQQRGGMAFALQIVGPWRVSGVKIR